MPPHKQDNQGKDVGRNGQDEASEDNRHRLLDLLFGTKVPVDLEGELLRTSDVARLFQVSERTVSEWAKRGHIPSVRTPGGHRRYPAERVKRLLEQASTIVE